MTIIFKAKSNEAYALKILAELLANNIKTGCFEIDSTGIFLRMMDHHRRVLIDLNLSSESSGFTMFKFSSKKMFLGINLTHFHKMVRPIKKKDQIELFIDDEFPNNLCIKVTPKENNRTTTSTVKIQSIQNLEIDLPTGYSNPISISSINYQKMLKELGNIGNSIQVSAKKYSINFSCSATGVYGRTVSFGNTEDNDDDDEDVNYDQEFNTETLSRISKLAGLNTNIQIYPGKPLYFKSNVGNLGEINIYIKSKEQIEKDSCTIDNSDSDYD
jgi:proliferating cell nuclear antigen PCNA